MKKTVQKSVCAALVTAALICSAPTASALSYQQGDEAEEIKTIQTALTELDLYYVEITGHFGKRTAAAVKKFQKKVGLPQTGIVDNDTRELLYLRAGVTSSGSSGGSGTTISGGVTSSGTISTDLVLREGSRGDAVTALQEQLQSLKYFTGTVTGHYGRLTKEAVRLFQKDHDLDADGIAGRRTLTALAELKTGTSSGGGTAASPSIHTGTNSGTTVSTNAATAVSGTTLLKLGVVSEDVRKLQQNLTTLEYYSGSVTGKYGKLTKEAVRIFQKDHDLTADGVAGPKTLARLSEVMAGKTGTTTPGATAAPNTTTTTTPGTGTAATTPNTGTTAATTPSTGTTTAATTATIAPSVSLLNVGTLNTERVLRRRSNSGYVTRLQNALNALGYFKETSTGYFGSVTEEAVIAYQKAKGLTADGIAGRATLTAINEDIARGTVVLASGSID